MGAAAFHLKVKSLHKKPTIYNFSYSEHSKKYGISESSLRRYIPKLIEMGVGFFSGNNFQFKGTDAIKQRYGTKRICHIVIDETDSIQDIKDKIRVLLIRENQIEQKNIIEKKKRNILETEQFRQTETLDDSVHISLEGIANLLGLNKSGAQNFIEKAKNKGLLASRMIYKLVKHVQTGFNVSHYREVNPEGYFFVRGKCLYRHYGQEYFCGAYSS